MADEHNGPAGTPERHRHDGHDHDHEDDVDLLEEGTTPAADVAPGKTGPVQTLRTYAPVIISLVGLLMGIVLDKYADWFKDPVRLIGYIAAYLPVGWPVLKRAWKGIVSGNVFTEFFLMGVATLGAFGIREYPEGVAVMLFYTIGELFQDAAVLRARRSIKALLDVRPDEVTVMQNGKPQTVKAATVAVGAVVQVKPGEKVGLDGTMRSESGTFDTAALTGESVPRTIAKGESVLAGMINRQSLVEMDVTTPYQDSKLSRILKLVQQATGRKAQTQEFIARFAKIYTPAICGLALLITLVPYFFVADYQFRDWLYRGLVFLVIGCPCALVISIPLGYFGGIGAGSKQGILFKGSVFLDLVTQLKTVVMDKTGTLTKGVFAVQEVKPVGIDANKLAQLTAALESKSTHPVATALLAYARANNGRVHDGEKGYESISVEGVEEIPGHGLKGRVDGKEMLAGNAKLLQKFSVSFDDALTQIPYTIVMAALDGQFSGYFTIADEVKPDAAEAVKRLKADGIYTVMLSGDKSAVVEAVAKQVGVDEWHGDLLPEDKVTQVERLKADLSVNPKSKLAFVGDGVNDAPVVALADVGIAMGGLGSDATIETADVIIQNDEPAKIAMSVAIGRATRRIVWQNITLSLVVKGIVLVLGAGGLATMWEAVFADVGVAMLAILNAVRVQNLKF
ncbi:heavy metal translocating P-type ATPase [Spirosoma sp. KCTC 42546]|uniref:heavy metal translocating P-type ATPase n=1 Tax=Spirosoma sp. KCTC 42546 TaxID=2520506 RepID=UPI0011585809|nr:heavy metal translocating P-type ATPase [Spirosoma sp. KCTC 42546]QDK77793.1 heavy metal translocating P-type ATPase [Spirosoma sp. KCTC 42546]